MPFAAQFGFDTSRLICKINSGSYTGDGTANRGIPHGLGKAPKYVIIFKTDGAHIFHIYKTSSSYDFVGMFNVASVADVVWDRDDIAIPDATNFYVSDTKTFANVNLSLYSWIAFA